MDKLTFEEFYPKIYNYVYCRVLHREDTEDLTGEVFYKAVAHANQYDSRRASYSTWLFAIARNCVLKFYRDRKNVLSFEDFTGAMEIAADTAAPDEAFFADEEAYRLHKALLTLPERERTVLALRFWGEFSYKEIAKHTGLTESNVGVILKRTIQKLRTSSYNDL